MVHHHDRSGSALSRRVNSETDHVFQRPIELVRVANTDSPKSGQSKVRGRTNVVRCLKLDILPYHDYIVITMLIMV